MNIYSDRIDQLRKQMKKEGIDVYYVPMSDCHASEYVGDHFRCIEFLTGFSGSAGHVIITKNEAFLFTDGRYYIQAAGQIEGSGVRLMKWGEPEVPEPDAFLRRTAKGKVLGFDGCVVSASFAEKISKTASDVRYKKDLVGGIWTDRPEQTFTEIREMPPEYCGETTESKLQRIRDAIDKMELPYQNYAYLLSSLDDIAWIFNIRANDIPNNPVAYANAVIGRNEARLLTKGNGYGREWYTACKAVAVPEDSIPEIVVERIRDRIQPVIRNIAESERKEDANVVAAKIWDRIQPVLKNIAQSEAKETPEPEISCVLMDTKKAGYSTWRYFKDLRIPVIHIEDPSVRMKSVKNETEIACLKQALIRDSAVVIRLMHWVKTQAGKVHMDELSVDEFLLRRRGEDPLFIEPSFDTIAAYKENAAMMHYEATTQTARAIHAEGMLLVDSGGQYKDGTTDITRTFLLGPVSAEEKKCFTLTAVSMLRLLYASFLKGCRGENLDIIARAPMWREGMDYKCGTGHGVGHVLNVHEGPQGIRWRIGAQGPSAVLEEGMVVTNEPGVYKEGRFGIRTENEMLVVADRDTEDGSFLRFENLTFVPIDLDGIDITYLTDEDKKLLNNYHESVYETMAPFFEGEMKDWLREYTRPV